MNKEELAKNILSYKVEEKLLQDTMFNTGLKAACRIIHEALEGYAIVPVEPSEEMIEALMCEWESFGTNTMSDNYKAMIEASE